MLDSHSKSMGNASVVTFLKTIIGVDVTSAVSVSLHVGFNDANA
jgi:hypothetical protein